MKKRIISLLMVIVLSAAAIIGLASCGEDNSVHEKYSAYSFVYDSALGGLVINLERPQDLNYTATVIIPESSYYWADSEGGNQTDHAEAKAVVAIKSEAFKNDVSIVSMILPTYLKKIGAGAFEGCTSLKAVSISSDITEIGDDAFSGCGELRTFTLSELAGDKKSAVKTIGRNAFNSCLKLYLMDFEFAAQSTIGEKAFYYDANLPNLDLSNVSYVGSKAFAGYNPSKTIKTPSSTSAWAVDWKG